MSDKKTWHWEKAISRDGGDTVSLRDSSGIEIMTCEEDTEPDAECSALIAASPDMLGACEAFLSWKQFRWCLHPLLNGMECNKERCEIEDCPVRKIFDAVKKARSK